MVVRSRPAKSGRCSFCLQTEPDVRWMVEGDGVYICNECVRLCLDAVEGERGSMDATAVRLRRSLWFTNAGEMREVPDHADFARTALGLMDMSANASVAALHAGWIAVTSSATRTQIKYAERAMIGAAAERLALWLLEIVHDGTRITRSLLADGRWIEVDHPSVASVAQTLRHAAAIAAATSGTSRRKHFVARQPMDRLGARLGAIHAALKQSDGSAASVADFAFNWHDRNNIGLHRVNGEEVRLICSGKELIRNAAFALGCDLRERADLAYAMPVRQEILTAITEGEPAHYDRSVSIDGEWHWYQNLKYASRADATGTSFVLTASDVLVRGVT
jgi:ClpX C4-type zinc finger